MNLGYTGTRNGMNPKQKELLEATVLALEIKYGPIEEFHHGDCVGGDEEFDAFMDTLFDSDSLVHPYNPTRVIHPGPDGDLRAHCELNKVRSQKTILSEPQTHFARNRHIVQATDIIIGAPAYEGTLRTGGTYYTIDHARKKGKPVYVLQPSGKVTIYRTAARPLDLENINDL